MRVAGGHSAAGWRREGSCGGKNDGEGNEALNGRNESRSASERNGGEGDEMTEKI